MEKLLHKEAEKEGEKRWNRRCIRQQRKKENVLHNEREVMTQTKNIQYIFILSRSDFIEEKLE